MKDMKFMKTDQFSSNRPLFTFVSFVIFGAPSKLGRTYKLKGVCLMN